MDEQDRSDVPSALEALRGGHVRARPALFALCVAVLPVGAAILQGWTLDALHGAAIPIALCYAFCFHPAPCKVIRWYHGLYAACLAVLVGAYLASLAYLIPETRVTWIEWPLALGFLVAVHVVVWLIDRTVRAGLTLLGRAVPARRFPRGRATVRVVLRIILTTALAVPYLLAVFSVHWVKFGDQVDPTTAGPQELGMPFESVFFAAADGARDA